MNVFSVTWVNTYNKRREDKRNGEIERKKKERKGKEEKERRGYISIHEFWCHKNVGQRMKSMIGPKPAVQQMTDSPQSLGLKELPHMLP